MSVSPDDGVVSGAWQRSEVVGAAPAASVPDLPVQMTGQCAGAAPLVEKSGQVTAVPTAAAAAAAVKPADSRCCSCSLASGCDDLVKCECRRRRSICAADHCACRPGSSHCTNYHAFATDGASRVRKPAAGTDAYAPPVRTASVTPSPRKKSAMQRTASSVRQLQRAGDGVAPCVADSAAPARSARSSLRFGPLTSPAGQTAMDHSVAQFDGAQSAAEVALLLLQPEVDVAPAAAVEGDDEPLRPLSPRSSTVANALYELLQAYKKEKAAHRKAEEVAAKYAATIAKKGDENGQLRKQQTALQAELKEARAKLLLAHERPAGGFSSGAAQLPRHRVQQVHWRDQPSAGPLGGRAPGVTTTQPAVIPMQSPRSAAGGSASDRQGTDRAQRNSVPPAVQRQPAPSAAAATAVNSLAVVCYGPAQGPRCVGGDVARLRLYQLLCNIGVIADGEPELLAAWRLPSSSPNDTLARWRVQFVGEQQCALAYLRWTKLPAEIRREFPMQLSAGDLRVQIDDAELSAMRAQLLAQRAQQRQAQHPSPEAPVSLAVAASSETHAPDRRVVATSRESGGPLYAGGLRVEVRLPPELVEQRRRKWRQAPAQCPPHSAGHGAEIWATPAPERRHGQSIDLTDDRNIHNARCRSARSAAGPGPIAAAAAAAAASHPSSARWQEDWLSDSESA